LSASYGQIKEGVTMSSKKKLHVSTRFPDLYIHTLSIIITWNFWRTSYLHKNSVHIRLARYNLKSLNH